MTEQIFDVEYVEINKKGEIYIEGRIPNSINKDIPRMVLVFSKYAWAELQKQLRDEAENAAV